MKKLLGFLLFAALVGCNDGEIITNDFDFEDTAVNTCGIVSSGTTSNYVFYKNRTTLSEALLLNFQASDDISVLGSYGPYSLGSTNSFEYRSFNSAATDSYFCSTVPPNSPQTIESFIAEAGELYIETAISSEEDSDGIPSELEGSETLDTDGDGIPNFKDLDDDGDNVPTDQEGVVITNGVIDTVLSRDTDGDGMLDYLDNDDDNDGVLTIQESTDGDEFPANDIEFNESLPNYRLDTNLEPANPVNDVVIEHTFSRVIGIQFTIDGLLLSNTSEEFIADPYDFGSFFINSTVTVTF